MKEIKFLILILIVILVLDACHKIEHLSPIPGIEYTSFTIFDTTDILGNHSKAGNLMFRFEDGDGDLGLNAPSPGEIDSVNLFIKLFRKVDGIMTPATDTLDPLKPSPFRIPYMERLGQNKILKGSISVTFLYLFYLPTDTIRYDFFVKDRAQNESNVASTNEIVISENNVY